MNNNGVILTLCSYILNKVKVLYSASGLKRLVDALSRFFSKHIQSSLFFHLLAADNPAAERAVENSVFGKVSDGIEGLSVRGEKPRLGFIPDNLSRVLGNIPFTSCRSFGMTLVCLSFGAGASYIIKERSMLTLVITAGCALLGILLMTINRSFWNLFGSSWLAGLAAGFFGYEDICAENKPQVNHHTFYAVLGLLVGGAFAALDLTMFIMTAGALIGGILIMYKTEVGIFAAALLMPIAPTTIILGICGVTVLSYFSKILIVRGNNLPFKLGKLDVIAVLFAVTLVYSVCISYRRDGSIFVASIYLLYILFFIAVKNTIRTKKMLVAAISLLAVSGLLVSLYGVYQQLTGQFVETVAWIDDEMFTGATARIYSTLENPNVLGEYLIFVIMIAFGMLYYMKKPVYKVASLGVLGISALCILFTQSRGAWLGLLFALAMFAVMRDRRLVVLGVVAILFMPAFLPMSIIERFMSIGDLRDSSTSYRVNIWLGCLIMLRTIWFTGIGPGEASFRHVYQEYAFNATEAPHSHNLYLQVFIDQGVFGFIVFLLLLIIFFKTMFNAYRKQTDNFVRTAICILSAAMFGYLVQGLTEHVWYNNRVVAYFWLILALGGALSKLKDDEKGVRVYGQAG